MTKTTKLTRIPNLSRAMTLILAQTQAEQDRWADLALMDGSGECGPLVDRANRRARRVLRRRVHAITGFPYRLVIREAQRRVSGGWFYRSGIEF